MRRFFTTSVWSILISLSVLFFSLSSCESRDEFSRLPDGTNWKLLSFSDRGRNLDSAEIIYFNGIITDLAGQTLHTFYDKGFFAVDDSLWTFLRTRQTGDSLRIIRSEPDFLNSRVFQGDTLVYHLYIDRMRTARELADDRLAETLYLDSLIRNDSVRRYYTEREGIYYRQTQKGDSVAVDEGREIVIHYRGWTASGTLFDDSRRMRAPLRFVYGNEDQVIEGIDRALKYMHRGESGFVIIPSRFAFGARGTGRGRVPPFTPVIYHLEVRDLGE